MIELLMLWSLTKTIGRIVRAKGRKALGYQALTVGLWFGGEFAGAIAGVLFATWVESTSQLLVYLFALLGAAGGAWAAHAIAVNLQAPLKCPACGVVLGAGYNYPQCDSCGAPIAAVQPAVEKPAGL